jgi:hypothetical protein
MDGPKRRPWEPEELSVLFGSPIYKDALRAAGVNEDVNDALTGHGGGNAVARGYGSDDMVRRFGFPTLNAAVEKAQYPGLDLSHLRWTTLAKSQ